MTYDNENHLKNEQNSDKDVKKYKKNQTEKIIYFPDNIVKRKINGGRSETNMQSVEDRNNMINK